MFPSFLCQCFHGFIQMSKLTKSYTLKGYTLLYKNYIPIKLIKKNLFSDCLFFSLANLHLIWQGLEIFHCPCHHLLNTVQVAQVPPRVCPELEPMLQMWFEQIRVQWVSVLPLFITVYSYQALLFSDFLVYFRYSISVNLNVVLLSVQLKFLWIFLEVCSH